MSNIILKANGQQYDGWTNMTVSRSIETAAGYFDLGLTERYPAQDNPIMIRPNYPVELWIGDELVITGRVDSINISGDAASRSVSVSGRSRTRDIVDCSVQIQSDIRNKTLVALVNQLCAPYGVSAISTEPDEIIKKFKSEPDETVYEAIERLCQPRGLLVTDDTDGNLILTRAGSERSQTAIRSRKNIMSYSGAFDASQIYDEYNCRGQRVGDDHDFGLSVADVFGSATDDTLGSHRVLNIDAGQPITAKQARDRAIWEAANRQASALRASYTLSSWLQGNGQLWTPNLLVEVDDPDFLKIQGDLLIVSVTYSMSESLGEECTLDLALPESFNLSEPSAQAASAPGKISNVAGYWKELDDVTL